MEVIQLLNLLFKLVKGQGVIADCNVQSSIVQKNCCLDKGNPNSLMISYVPCVNGNKHHHRPHNRHGHNHNLINPNNPGLITLKDMLTPSSDPSSPWTNSPSSTGTPVQPGYPTNSGGGPFSLLNSFLNGTPNTGGQSPNAGGQSPSSTTAGYPQNLTSLAIPVTQPPISNQPSYYPAIIPPRKLVKRGVIQRTVYVNVPEVKVVYKTLPPEIISAHPRVVVVTKKNQTITETVTRVQPPVTIIHAGEPKIFTKTIPPVFVTCPAVEKTIIKPYRLPDRTVTQHAPKITVTATADPIFLTKVIQAPVATHYTTMPIKTVVRPATSIIVYRTVRDEVPTQVVPITQPTYVLTNATPLPNFINDGRNSTNPTSHQDPNGSKPSGVNINFGGNGGNGGSNWVNNGGDPSDGTSGGIPVIAGSTGNPVNVTGIAQNVPVGPNQGTKSGTNGGNGPSDDSVNVTGVVGNSSNILSNQGENSGTNGVNGNPNGVLGGNNVSRPVCVNTYLNAGIPPKAVQIPKNGGGSLLNKLGCIIRAKTNGCPQGNPLSSKLLSQSADIAEAYDENNGNREPIVYLSSLFN